MINLSTIYGKVRGVDYYLGLFLFSIANQIDLSLHVSLLGLELIDLYQDNKLYVEKYCLPQKRCYKFIFGDFYGDGLCCGQGEGYWKISYGGNVIRESDFTVSQESFPQFYQYSPRFGKCQQSELQRKYFLRVHTNKYHMHFKNARCKKLFIKVLNILLLKI